jgi:HK97 family phage prohead protease
VQLPLHHSNEEKGSWPLNLIFTTMRTIETKGLKQAVLDLDTTGKAVKVAVASFDNIDLDGDVFDTRAFNKTIGERGPMGSNQIWHLTNHFTSLSAALGKPKEIGIDGQFLYFVSDYKDTPLWNAIWPLYETGDITEHSVGFSIVDQEQKQGYRLIKEAMLWEGSAVLWGANPNTPTIEVGKSLEEKQNELDKLNNELNLLSKSIKDGRFTDESFELIEIRFKQVQERISQLFNILTQPVEKTVEPSEELKQAILLQTLKFKI